MSPSYTTDQSIRDYLAMGRRRRRLMLSVFLGTMGVSLALAVFLPKLFKSSARITIERPQQAIVDSTASEQHIERLRKKVTAHDSLNAVVEEYNLFPDMQESSGDRVGALRDAMELIYIVDEDSMRSRSGPEILGFSLGVFHPSADAAQRLAQRLAERFIEEDRLSRLEEVRTKTAFYEAEADKQRDALREADARLAEYREQNKERLPETTRLTMSSLERAERDLDTVEDEIRTLEERKSLLMVQLSQTPQDMPIIDEAGQVVMGSQDQLRLLQQEYISLLARYPAEHPDVRRKKREIEVLSNGSSSLFDAEALRNAVAREEAELASLRERYGEDHPDVRAKERSVTNLRSELATLPRRASASSRLSSPVNPAWQQIKVQIDSTNGRLADLRGRQGELRQKISEMEGNLVGVYDIGGVLASLERDVDIAEKAYRDAVDDLGRAREEIAKVIAEQSERLSIEDYPVVPRTPARPRRVLISAIGIVLGLTLALGLAIVVESLDPRVRGTKDLVAVLGTPPIAVIPMIDGSRRETSTDAA